MAWTQAYLDDLNKQIEIDQEFLDGLKDGSHQLYSVVGGERIDGAPNMISHVEAGLKSLRDIAAKVEAKLNNA